MQLGMIGLGRMGANIVRRLVRAGHSCVVFDVDAGVTAALAAEHDAITGVSSLADLAAALDAPRNVWLMVPAALTDRVAGDVAAVLSPGDTIIDGGNSHYHDDLRRGAELDARGIHYVDCGTSGGVWGLDRGYCLMIGGDDEAVDRLRPIWEALAPGLDAAPERTRGRSGDPAPEEQGWLHCGPVGAGHFVKMVHNGIEYGLMAAYAEGLDIIRHAGIGLAAHQRATDAETSPLEHPEHYRYEIDVSRVAEVWRRGSVVASWLLDLTAAALHDDPDLAGFGGSVSDSGEGRWTVAAAVDEGVPAPVITAALYQRFASRNNGEFTGQVLSAMRKEFGGHAERPKGSG